jgi:glycosyltransferase involved in cell wall biosynthesis
VEFLGWVGDDELAKLYATCKAVVFPGEEDFGIVPVEAQASGRPVIAYGKGGARETILPDVTGIFFREQTPQSLDAALRAFEAVQDSFDPPVIRLNAEQFRASRFREEFERFLGRCLEEHKLQTRGSSENVG